MGVGGPKTQTMLSIPPGFHPVSHRRTRPNPRAKWGMDFDCGSPPSGWGVGRRLRVTQVRTRDNTATFTAPHPCQFYAIFSHFGGCPPPHTHTHTHLRRHAQHNTRSLRRQGLGSWRAQGSGCATTVRDGFSPARKLCSRASTDRTQGLPASVNCVSMLRTWCLPATYGGALEGHWW
jgi:hypothetical protein